MLLIFWFERLKKQSNSIFFLVILYPFFLYTYKRSCNVADMIFAYLLLFDEKSNHFFRLDSMRLFSAEFSSRFSGKLMAGDHENWFFYCINACQLSIWWWWWWWDQIFFLAKSCLIFGLHNTVLTMDAVRGKTHYWGGKIKIFQKKILFSCFIIKYTLFLFHNNPFHIVI